MEARISFTISFSTGAMVVLPLAWTFRVARRAGFRDVELVLNAEAIVRGPAAVERLARRHGVAIQSLHPPILRIPGWPREASQVSRVVRYASRMSVPPLVVLHVPNVKDMAADRGVRYRDELARWREGRETHDVRLAIETPGYFRESDDELALGDPAHLADFARDEEAEVVLDTVHAASMGYDLIGAYEALRPRLANVHLSDLGRPTRSLDRPAFFSYLKHHQLPGEGSLDLKPLLRRLAEDEYRGLVTLELSPVAIGLWSRRRVLRTISGSLAYVQENAIAGRTT